MQYGRDLHLDRSPALITGPVGTISPCATTTGNPPALPHNEPIMKSAKSIGRTLGILLLLQLALGLMLPFILMAPLNTGTPGFLTAAAESSSQIRSAVLLSFVGA